MGIIRSLFGPNREEVWAQLSSQIDGQVVGGGWRGSKVQAQVGHWTLTLDTFTESQGDSSSTFTRMRAPFVNRDQFRFNIHRAGLGTRLAKFFGLQDIEVGDPAFDEAFVVQSNSEPKIRALLSSPRIRELLLAQKRIGQFAIKDGKRNHRTSRYLPGVDLLYFHVVGVVKDVSALKSLFELFAEVLNHLGQLESADVEDVEHHLRALRGPGGQITSDHVVIWDGDPARAAAAQSLGSLRAWEAVPDLLMTLSERDPGLRANAAWALGEIGDPAAVSALIPLLGDEARPDTRPVSEFAGAALRQLGQGQFVDALGSVIAGGRSEIEILNAFRGPALTEALERMLDSEDQVRAVNSAWAAGELGMVELLPRLRECQRRLRRTAAPSDFEQIGDAIRRLETQTRLPRPAAAPSTHAQLLPGPSQQPGDGGD